MLSQIDDTIPSKAWVCLVKLDDNDEFNLRARFTFNNVIKASSNNIIQLTIAEWEIQIWFGCVDYEVILRFDRKLFDELPSSNPRKPFEY